MAEAHGMVSRTVGFVELLVRRGRQSGDRHLRSHAVVRSEEAASASEKAQRPLRVDEGRSPPGGDRG